MALFMPSSPSDPLAEGTCAETGRVAAEAVNAVVTSHHDNGESGMKAPIKADLPQ